MQHKGKKQTLKTESNSKAHHKIIMNYPNQNSQAPFPFGLLPFHTWNQAPYSVPSVPSPHFPSYSQNPPLNFLVQQQNNYFNSNFSMQRLSPVENGLFGSAPSFQRHATWGPRSEFSRPPVKQLMKKKPEVICLDDDSPVEAIVIQDSEQIISQKYVKPPIPQVREIEIEPKSKGHVPEKTQLQQIVQKQFKQKGLTLFLHKNKKNPFAQPEPKNPQPAFSDSASNAKKSGNKVAKKKSIQHERYSYKLRHHEKKLMELSDCRDYCYGEILTGPQFQATLPPFRLFSKSQSWLARKKNRLMERRQY